MKLKNILKNTVFNFNQYFENNELERNQLRAVDELMFLQLHYQDMAYAVDEDMSDYDYMNNFE